MNFGFSKIFERGNKKDSPESDEKIFSECLIFIENFDRKMSEAEKLFKKLDEKNDQILLGEIESLITDMKSNLKQLEDLIRQTNAGKDYFLLEETRDRDSLVLVQQKIIIENTPIENYIKMSKSLDRFIKDCQSKIFPLTSDLEN